LLLTLHRDLNHPVAFAFKELIRLVNFRKWIGVRDQRLGIELTLGNELQRFLAIASVNAAGSLL
jgi:hypothetical protein